MSPTPPSLRAAALLAALLPPAAAAQQHPAAALAARAVPAADLRHRYGADSLREGELWLPRGPGPHPIAVIVHGGCWLAPFADHRYMRPLAVALRDDGFAVWNVRYRRADEAGGGWPGTFDDVASAVDALRAVVAADRALLRVAGVVAIDGVGDLPAAAAAAPRICGGPVFERLLGGTAADQPARWRAASPAAWLPLGVPQAVVIGWLERPLARFGTPDATQAAYARRARAAGDSAWAVAADSTHHFNMLDPEHPMAVRTRRAVRDVFAALRR